MISKIEYYLRVIAIIVIVTSISFMLLRNTAYYMLFILPGILLFTLLIWFRLRIAKAAEINFPVFLSDLKDLLQGGMPLVQAIELSSKNNYGLITSFIERIAGQTKLGVPFDSALKEVFSEIDSALIRKTIFVISETHKRGGNLIKIFDITAHYISEIYRMKKTRKTMTYSTLFTTYLMFFIFLGIIIGIQGFFLPLLTKATLFQGQAAITTINFGNYFLYLVIIQSILSGPMIGKISENSFLAGMKHSLILVSFSVPLYIFLMSLF